MKKTSLLFYLVVCVLTGQAQPKPLPAAGYTVVTDTLHYYLNKYYFTHGSMNMSTFPNFRTPHTSPSSNNPDFIGVRFENADTVIVTGLEGIMCKGPITVGLSVPVRMYLCTLDISGKPVIPGIDSISMSVNATNMKVVGGNFASSRTLTTDYAVLYKNWSGIAGDSVYVAHNAGVPVSNSSAPASSRFSDVNYAYIRHQGQFYNTANFTAAPGFGTGTDYEFMLAPRVQYRFQASHKIPQEILDANAQSDSICTRTPFTFTNTSSYFYTNRFYNLLELYRKWSLHSPFIVSPLAGWPSDSAVSWYFEFDDQPPFIVNPIKPLPYKHQGQNHQSVTAATDLPGCFPANEFRAVLKQMHKFGLGSVFKDNQPFNICMKYCNGDAVAIKENRQVDRLTVFPNPVADDKVTISGLKGNSYIKLMDVTGRMLAEFSTRADTQELDLHGLTDGSYFLMIENESGQNWVKIVR